MGRLVCPKCGFIIARCLCDSIAKISNQIPIIVLQHPSEKKHALNTVVLMKKCYENISVFEGENFNEHKELQNIIINHSPALLFPSQENKTLSRSQKISHLILIDGTWNKAKKIYFTSTILHLIPTFTLEAVDKSKYKIRSSQFENSLSTLEASTEALTILEPELNTNALLKSFEKMIEFQIEKMGPDTYLENYAKKKGSH
jgi:DTW domain-containing protein YfiP